MEDNFNGKWPKWKTNSMEDNLNERWPQWKTALIEDDLSPSLFSHISKFDIAKLASAEISCILTLPSTPHWALEKEGQGWICMTFLFLITCWVILVLLVVVIKKHFQIFSHIFLMFDFWCISERFLLKGDVRMIVLDSLHLLIDNFPILYMEQHAARSIILVY